MVVLLEDELHRREVNLSLAEWLSLATWVDANAPYYDALFNKHPAGGGWPKQNVAPEFFTPFASDAKRRDAPLAPRPGVLARHRRVRST